MGRGRSGRLLVREAPTSRAQENAADLTMPSDDARAMPSLIASDSPKSSAVTNSKDSPTAQRIQRATPLEDEQLETLGSRTSSSMNWITTWAFS
jgi:hypothetical protein